MPDDINIKNVNLLYHVPTVRITHMLGTFASGVLRNQGDLGCLTQEVLHASSIRQKVEDSIGLGTVAAIGVVAGYIAANALFKRY